MNYDDARAAVAAGADPFTTAEELVAALTPEERLGCLDGDAPTLAGLNYLMTEDGYHRMPFAAAEIDRVGMPGVHFADGPRGCVVGNATAFPVSMARGATWDPELEERIGRAIGLELRAAGADLTGAVCVNVLRHPAWGRAQETYGEDPHHVGELGAAFTRGLQHHVMACVKHFACNSMENARFSVDIEVDDVALHEVYLPHFRRIVDEGVASVMTAYNSVNGEWCGESERLVADVLRGEWGFEGFVISDWVFGLRDAANSVRAGLDIEMPYRMVRAANLPYAIEQGDVSMAEVDAAATRVVSTLLRFDEILSQPAPPRELLGAPEHRALARDVAARSSVLLRNEAVAGAPVLPFATTDSVAVIGRLADRVNLGDGGSSDVWDDDCHTVLDGIRSAIATTSHDDGSNPERAAEVAAAADVAVVVVGYTHIDEGEFIGATDPALTALFPPADEPGTVEHYLAQIAAQPPTTKPERLADRSRGFSHGGDRSSLRLPDPDVALIRAVAAANPRTVVVIQAGSAVVIDEWVHDAAAVVQAWYGGCQAGPGLADVLLGTVNPSARLPFSVPVDEGDLPAFDRDATTFRYDRWHGWWHLANAGVAPAFPFGFGLSYTTFEVRETEVSLGSEGVLVRATVANTGDVDGADVVQVYAELPDPEAPHRLVAFQRVDVAAGEVADVELLVAVDAMSTRGPQERAWSAPAGEHHIVVARFAGDPDAQRHAIHL
ncbi:MAG: glycoside hydrolase family 3 N-terminal domain-containing protein [Actinomycetota bacterium]